MLFRLRPIHNEIHIIYRGGLWAVRRKRAVRASRLLDNKKLAIEYAKNLKKRTMWIDIVIHNKDGTVEKTLRV